MVFLVVVVNIVGVVVKVDEEGFCSDEVVDGDGYGHTVGGATSKVGCLYFKQHSQHVGFLEVTDIVVVAVLVIGFAVGVVGTSDVTALVVATVAGPVVVIVLEANGVVLVKKEVVIAVAGAGAAVEVV